MRINRQLNSGTDQCELIGADFPMKNLRCNQRRFNRQLRAACHLARTEPRL